MMKKKEIPKKLKGTVLFTVVSVMMVLIVFLVATLALASTASKRAYTNYQQEQAEYTAKAVMEAVVKQLQEDTDSSTIRGYVSWAASSGRSLEVTISDEPDKVHNVTITNTGKKQSVYESGEWQDLDVYRLSVTVDSDTTNASATYETFIGLGEIINETEKEEKTPSSGASGAFVSLGDTGGNELATHGYTTGGTYLGIGVEDYNFTMSSNGTNVIDAPFYVNGDLTSQVEMFMHFTKPNDFMVIKGDASFNNGGIKTSFVGYKEPTEATYETTPYIYIDGELSAAVGMTIGESNHAVNLFCGSVNLSGNGDVGIYGDLYLMDEKESIINLNAQNTKLYQWVGAQLTRADGNGETKFGNIYSNGSLTLTGTNKTLEVDGNVQISGDLTVTNMKVTGDVVVNGTLTVTGMLDANSIIATNVVGGTINATNGVQAVTSTVPFTEIDISALTSKGDRTIKTWYTDVVIDPEGESYWESGEGFMKVSYTKHTEIDGVAQPDEPVSNQDVVTWTSGLDPAAFDSFAAYAATVNDLANDIQTYTSEEHAKEDHISLGYDLSSVYGKEVYPSNYTKNALNNLDDEGNPKAEGKAKIETPQASTYEAIYPTSITSKKFETIFSGDKYTIPMYKSNMGGNAPKYETSGYVGSLSELDSKTEKIQDPLYPTDPSKQIDKTYTFVNGYYTINTSCVLNGNIANNIYISGTDITVVLDNVTLSNSNGSYEDANGVHQMHPSSIIIDDSSTVTLVIVGDANINNNNIITTDYLDLFLGENKDGVTNWKKSDNFQNIMGSLKADVNIKQIHEITDKQYPNVIINSDTDATLKTENGGLIVGMVRAPKLIFDAGQSIKANQTIKYTLPTGEVVQYGEGTSFGDVDGTKYVGLIGQLIAGQIKIVSNGQWGMLYVTDPSDSDDDDDDDDSDDDDDIDSSFEEISVYTMLYGNTY